MQKRFLRQDISFHKNMRKGFKVILEKDEGIVFITSPELHGESQLSVFYKRSKIRQNKRTPFQSASGFVITYVMKFRIQI
jgi:hypothetical protein